MCALLQEFPDRNLYCHCYKKDWLDSHLERSEKGIRFIDSKYNDLFRIPDGGLIQIEYPNDKPKHCVCRYIDPYHVEIHKKMSDAERVDKLSTSTRVGERSIYNGKRNHMGKGISSGA